jgi:chitin disaccharide deacetylase
MEELVPKRLIVNADDYGRTAGVSDGILQAHREGIVTSTTAMMNMPGIERPLRMARQEPDLGLGVHLVFTAGQPVLPPDEVPTLVDSSGHFLTVDVWQTSLGRMDLSELWAEWQAQIVMFHGVFVAKPDHLDCHHFIYLQPPIFELYLRLAQQERVPARVPLPSPFQPAQPGRESPDEGSDVFASRFGIQPEELQVLVDRNRAALQQFRVRHPDRFCPDFFGDEGVSLDGLLSILDRLPEGVTELMVHPGIADEALRTTSTYAAQRERELEILCHPAVKARVAAGDIELVNFGTLA